MENPNDSSWYKTVCFISEYVKCFHRPENPAGSTYCSTTGLSPLKQWERKAESPSSDKTRPEYPIPTLQARFDLNQKWRGNLRFLPQPEMRPSSIKTNPVESREARPKSTVCLTSQRHPEKLPNWFFKSHNMVFCLSICSCHLCIWDSLNCHLKF